jgi:hypothetical protein
MNESALACGLGEELTKGLAKAQNAKTNNP